MDIAEIQRLWIRDCSEVNDRIGLHPVYDLFERLVVCQIGLDEFVVLLLRVGE
jgi:hypothetical protein